ncbi:MAG: hypothetical protein ACM3SV_10090 [Betaproteobacteria bacterium]
MIKPAQNTPFKPRLLAFALADLFGVFCIAIGGSWFLFGKGAILAGFPNSLAEAVAALAGGIAVMVWAAARLVREVRQR